MSATIVVKMDILKENANSSSAIPNIHPLVSKPDIMRKRSSCPNLKMYVNKDDVVAVAGVDLSPTMDVDVEATYIEEKCCFLVPNGFLSGRKDGRRSSAEVSFEVCLYSSVGRARAPDYPIR